VNEILPVIQELGYAVDGVSIALGIIPDVTIDISGLAKTIEDAKYQQILEEHKGHKLRISVVKTLQTASSMHQKIRFGQMQAGQRLHHPRAPAEDHPEVQEGPVMAVPRPYRGSSGQKPQRHAH
jgi:hypothetical protein